MLSDSSAALFFPGDCLAEHSHLEPGPEQLQQPAHESLPDVAMANSLGNVAAQVFISGLGILVGKCGTQNSEKGSAMLLGTEGNPAFKLLVTSGRSIF